MAKLIRDRSTKEKDRWWSEVARAAESAPTLTYERRSAPMAKHWTMRKGTDIREQRRYEIARDVMAATAADSSGSLEVDAKFAVDAADALLAELERNDADG